jgi:phosphoribosylformylglycinamidine synthase subunit PurS
MTGDDRIDNDRIQGQSPIESAAGAHVFRFAVNVTPKPGILDPQGRAVEQSLPHLGLSGVSDVRVGRRVELSVAASSEAEARSTVDTLASEMLSNPLIEAYSVELIGGLAPAAVGSVR